MILLGWVSRFARSLFVSLRVYGLWIAVVYCGWYRMGLAVVDCGLMADTLTMSIFFSKDWEGSNWLKDRLWLYIVDDKIDYCGLMANLMAQCVLHMVQSICDTYGHGFENSGLELVWERFNCTFARIENNANNVQLQHSTYV